MSQDKPPTNDTRHTAGQPDSRDRSVQTDCERVLALIPAYSIGATDLDEEEFVKAKLGECPEAVAVLAEYMTLADALYHSARPIQPAPALAEALQEAIRAAPAPPSSRRVAMTPQQQAAQRSTGAIRQTLAGRYLRLSVALGVALLCLFLISNIYWLFRVQQLQSSQDQVASRLHDEDTALMLIGLSAANRIELPAVQIGPQKPPFAAIVLDPQGKYALLYVRNFPTLPPDKVYQLWLEQAGRQTSAGLFSVDEDGLGILVFQTSAPVPTFDTIEITVEPAQGSAKPTTLPIVQRKS